MLPTLFVILAAAWMQSDPVCAGLVVAPGPDQGMADSALVATVSHHDTGPRDLGTVLAMGQWRIIWAAPRDSEHGVFFFHGRKGSERLLEVWGGAGASRKEAFGWATHKLQVPAPLARCFADRLAADGV